MDSQKLVENFPSQMYQYHIYKLIIFPISCKHLFKYGSLTLWQPETENVIRS
jgi:hypothetical protein